MGGGLQLHACAWKFRSSPGRRPARRPTPRRPLVGRPAGRPTPGRPGHHARRTSRSTSDTLAAARSDLGARSGRRTPCTRRSGPGRPTPRQPPRRTSGGTSDTPVAPATASSDVPLDVRHPGSRSVGPRGTPRTSYAAAPAGRPPHDVRWEVIRGWTQGLTHRMTSHVDTPVRGPSGAPRNARCDAGARPRRTGARMTAAGIRTAHLIHRCGITCGELHACSFSTRCPQSGGNEHRRRPPRGAAPVASRRECYRERVTPSAWRR